MPSQEIRSVFDPQLGPTSITYDYKRVVYPYGQERQTLFQSQGYVVCATK